MVRPQPISLHLNQAKEYDMSIAGHRRPAQPEMTIDYADVLRQAVENERWRVLRDIRVRVELLKTTESRVNPHRVIDRTAADIKRDILRELDNAEVALS